MPDSTVLTLRKETPSADSCGDLFQKGKLEGFLPVGCGAEAVFNFSLEKELLQYGSGDDDDDYSEGTATTMGPRSIGTAVIPTRSLLSTAAHRRTTSSATATGEDMVPVTPNKSVARLPPRFTASPEDRHSSFQHLLRMHLNTFNQRLSMLERNTLDMKESIHTMKDQQSSLSSKLEKLIAIQPATENKEKVGELEKSYTDMQSRLSRLEGRLEILIDGFTALAQEMNKIKRTRHISHSPQERRVLPPLTAVFVPSMYTTQLPTVRITPTEKPLASRATVPKSIPTPRLPVNKRTTASLRDRKRKPSATTKSTSQPRKNSIKLKSATRSSKSQVTRSTIKFTTTLSKPRTSSRPKPQATMKPEIKRPVGKRPAVTARRPSQRSQTKPRRVKEEVATTKFQLDPPSHKSKPAKKASKTPPLPRPHNKADKRDATKRNDGRRKSFRSDAPEQKKVQQGVKTAEVDSKKLSKPNNGNSNQHRKKSERNTFTLASPSHKTQASQKSKVTATTTKPAKTITAKKLSKTKMKGKPQSSPSKKKQRKKKTKTHSSVVDLLRLLRGDHKSTKETEMQDGSLHVVLGRLAIPIRIIPDN